MKNIASKVLALGIAAVAFTACDDAKNDVIDNMVYISEAATSPASEVVVGKVGEKSKANIKCAWHRKPPPTQRYSSPSIPPCSKLQQAQRH